MIARLTCIRLTRTIYRYYSPGHFSNPEHGTTIIDKVLIANRGEIACRIIKTLNKLNIKSVAIYSDCDRHSQHVLQADEAYLVGGNETYKSYLNGEKIIEICKLSKANAVHPGYGFLSENHNFANLASQNNVEFIGPPTKAIIDMGSKSESKKIMTQANVPVIPGYHGSNQEPEHLLEEATKIGFPVLIKAVMGGGGKGMRIVEYKKDFYDLLERAKSEALKYCKDDAVLIEKYIKRSRHIEVQVFGDKHGNYVHLYERDCSIQRRHQKIIEEAPAPNLDKEIRKSLGQKAINAAKAVNYYGAGTVEFIFDCDTKEFYFMEMNTRLQVEHPVSEMITGLDFVQWQIEVAKGNKLPLTQEQIQCRGHAFEARIYAENPNKNFLPDTGKLKYMRTPKGIEKDNVRVETGVIEGDEISIYYDPMISKLVTFGKDRQSALNLMRRSIGSYHIAGVETNIDFMKKIFNKNNFLFDEIDTAYIQKHNETLFSSEGVNSNVLIASAFYELRLENIESHKYDDLVWKDTFPFRINSQPKRTFAYSKDHEIYEIEVFKLTDDEYSFCIKNNNKTDRKKAIIIEAQKNSENTIRMQIEEKLYSFDLFKDVDKIKIFHQDKNAVELQIYKESIGDLDREEKNVSGKYVISPMPCKITKIMVSENDSVSKGAALVVLESMKMEHIISASKDCIIKSVSIEVGRIVGQGEKLFEIE